MRITNLEKGEAYQLSEGAKMEIERTNPFFNDYGEQSVPMDLPASEYNRRLLGYPDHLGRTDKMTKTKASIQDGEYFAQCQQFVLSAQHKGSISTTFYINDGSFYARIQDIKLRDIFADDVVTFEGSDIPAKIQNAIAFCRGLRDGKDGRFGIFPILVTDDSGVDTGYNFKILNAFGKEETRTGIFLPDETGDDCDFYNAVERTEYVNETIINLAAGYYISPFIRANYVLKKIFKHFGYTLQDNFFTKTAPFNNMVLLNNVIDTLANGELKVADLLPDVTVSDFLAVFRKKFCCEFTSDDETMNAGVVFLKDVVASKPVADLTGCLTSEPAIQYKSAKDFKRVVLSSKDTVPGEVDDGYDNIKSLLSDNPGAYHDYRTGAFYKMGYSGGYSTRTKIAEASMPYNTGEGTEEHSIEVPDCMPEFRTLRWYFSDDESTTHHGSFTSSDDERRYSARGTFLYAGDYATLNSKLSVTSDDDQETVENSKSLSPMLAFAYMSEGTKPAGTISAYDLRGAGSPRIFDYALFYYGEDGIFERFYRDCDTLHRNALQQIKMKLLLTQSQKLNIAAYAKVVVRGVAFFFSKLKFSLGGKNEPMESELLSVTLTEPLAEAAPISVMLPMLTVKYKWETNCNVSYVDKSEYEDSGVDKDRKFTIVYPPTPSAEWVGKIYGKQVSYRSIGTDARPSYAKYTCWLTAVEGTSLISDYEASGGTVTVLLGGRR